MKIHNRVIFVLIFLLFTIRLYSQSITKNDIEKYVKTIDSLKSTNNLLKISYPDMSACGGGVDGYYNKGKLVYIDATYQAELGYSNRILYLNDTVFYKIIYREHFAEWNKYLKKYPKDEGNFNPKKMTYSDTLYTIILSSPICFIKTAKKKIISKNTNQKLINELITCGREMKQELDSVKQ